jgi:hypothetical protein
MINSETSELQRYNPSNNKWSNLKPMPYGLGHIGASCVPFAGGILIMGGRGNSDAAVHPNRMMFYDPVRETQVPSCSVLHQFTSSGSSIEKGGHAYELSDLYFGSPTSS